MGTASEVGLNVGCALLGAFVSYLLARHLENKRAIREAAKAAADARKEVAKAEAKRIQLVLVACRELRNVADKWYAEVRIAIDPGEGPVEIVGKLGKLFFQRSYEDRISDLQSIIKREPTCERVIRACSIWKESAYQQKSRASASIGIIYGRMMLDPSSLARAHAAARDDAGRRDKYLRDVQRRLFDCFGEFNDALSEALERLNEMESNARQGSIAGLDAASPVSDLSSRRY
jgi:hypothetical protein